MWLSLVVILTHIYASTQARTTILNIKELDERIMKPYKLLYPYEWEKGEFVDLEDIHNCYCPRVYWPVCSYSGVTYPNTCIMNCDQQSLRRLGPCIKYRRSMHRTLKINMPKAWRGTQRDELVKVTPGDFIVENITDW